MIFFAGALSSHAQARCNVNKAYAYFTVTMPGTQMVDEKGNPVPPVPYTDRFIFLECTGTKKPVIQAVRYTSMNLAVAAIKPEANKIIVGKKYQNEKEIILTAKKGNTLWRLDIQPTDDKMPDANASSNIIIQISSGGRTCSYKIGSEIQLYTTPSY